jgi:alkylhydroperoxidase family enzyme
MTIKTDVARFHVHDELTAPEGSDRMLKTIAETGGSISKFVGVLAGAPRALRVFARMRSELRAGSVPEPTQVRIALAVAERRGDSYSVAQHARTARQMGLGLDEISRARSFDSSDEREAHLLRLLAATVDADGHPPVYLIEEAREVDWTDEQILEALAIVALNEFQSLIANAGGLPIDQIDQAKLPDAA